jgi:Flp pilus assembly protein TadG
MTTWLRRFCRDERGMSLIWVGLGFMAFMAASTLAVDVGMLMTARTQTQTAADAGALAGATALAFDSDSDRTASGPAVRSAMTTSVGNHVMTLSPSVQVGDVTFPAGPTGLTNRVRVNAFMTGDRSNPVSTLIGPVFGRPTVDVTATATAEASPSNAATCVAPFTIPDKWIERQTPAWDPDDTFNAFPANPSLQPDVYHDANQNDYTGYDAQRDKGLQLTIKAGTGNNIAPSFYFALAVPGSTGASDYRWNIANCNTAVMDFGQEMVQEPGNMVGPTRQGVEDLIALDPEAYWDTATNRVVSTKNPSPRVKVVPVFDPLYWNEGKRNGRTADLKAANFIGFFIEGMRGNDVVGRITPVSGLVDGHAGDAPQGSFPRTIRLVQ